MNFAVRNQQARKSTIQGSSSGQLLIKDVNQYGDIAQLRAVEIAANSSSPTSLQNPNNVYDHQHLDTQAD